MNPATIAEIPLSKIVESGSNPRKTFGDLTELTESIKAKGVLQPVLVRTLGTAKYELVFGHRRARAAKAAGLVSIPAMVRELTDLEVLEAQVIENGQREDVHPLEEAEGFERLMKDHQRGVEDIAAKIGKDKSYVYKRLKLCALVPKARESFYEDQISPAVAYLVARVPTQLQVEALRAITRNNDDDDGPSLRWASEVIQRNFMLQLAGAPFDTKDADLVAGAGACATCPKRTGNQTELFADVKSRDVCTDPVCFAKKRDAGWKLLAAAAGAEGKRILNEKETKRVFPYEHDNEPSYNSPYVDLKQKCYEDPKHRTYAQLVGKVASVAIARDPRGGVHELIDKSQIPQLLKKAGHDFKASRSSSGNDSYDAKQKQADRRRKLLNRVGRAAMGELVTHVVNKGIGSKVWDALAGAAISKAWAETVGQIATRRGFDVKGVGHSKGDALRKSMKGMDETGFRGLVVEALLTPGATVNTWGSMQFGQEFRDACTAAGIDLKKLEREVAAEAKKPAKKASTKKPSAKKKPARPVGNPDDVDPMAMTDDDFDAGEEVAHG